LAFKLQYYNFENSVSLLRIRERKLKIYFVCQLGSFSFSMDSAEFNNNLRADSPPKNLEEFWPKQQGKIDRMTMVWNSSSI